MDTPLRHSASVTTLSSHAGQQMSKQTLQALSAVPRPRIVQSDQWVQRRKSDVPRGAHDLNYHHHWLIQVNILKFNNCVKSFFFKKCIKKCMCSLKNYASCLIDIMMYRKRNREGSTKRISDHQGENLKCT